MTASINREEFIDDLGPSAYIAMIEAIGGQLLYIPSPEKAETSKVAKALGYETTLWLAARFSGEYVKFPSPYSLKAAQGAARLKDAIRTAGLTEPTRTANDIAKEFGVRADYVTKLRAKMAASECDDSELFPLFRKL